MQTGTAMGRIFFGFTAAVCISLALFSYRYIPMVGPLSPDVLANAFFAPWLVLHVIGAATAMLIGPLQFSAGLRTRRPALHRWVGRAYVSGCAIGGVGGFVVALGTTAGPVAAAGFASLAVLWLGATIIAWRFAVARRIADHEAWMIRSWALTLAAVTLRLYGPPLTMAGLSYLDAYRATAFLSWIPNLIVAELYLRTRRRQRPPPLTAT